MPETTDAFVGLGSNLGDREQNIQSALKALESMPDTAVERASSLMENPAVDSPVPASDFLNGVAWLKTTLSAREILTALLEIERKLGRDRENTPKNAPRTIDLDLLLYGDAVIDEPDLQVPHPRMTEREFVLWPLLQIAGKLHDPKTGQPYATAYHDLKDKY